MTQAPARRIVVSDPEGPHAGQLLAELQQAGTPPEAWLAPRDADELEQLVEHGGRIEVTFATFGEYLTALWSGRVPLHVWRRLDIRCALPKPPHDRLPIRETLDAWETFTSSAARRRRVAALVLSIVAMAAAALILALA